MRVSKERIEKEEETNTNKLDNKRQGSKSSHHLNVNYKVHVYLEERNLEFPKNYNPDVALKSIVTLLVSISIGSLLKHCHFENKICD